MKNSAASILVVILVLSLLSACTRAVGNVRTPGVAPATSIAGPTATIPPTNTTPSQQTSTWLPPLSPTEANAFVLEMLETNGDCELPCWWGITPGETTWQQANDLLAPLGRVSTPTSRHGIAFYEVYLPKPEELNIPIIQAGGYDDDYFSPRFYVQDGIIIAISINSGWISPDFDYSLAGLLLQLGQPEEIWLSINTDIPPENDPEYQMELFYPKKGILIGAIGTAERQGDLLGICPQEFRDGIYPPGIALWSPTMEISFQDTVMKLFGGIVSWRPSEYTLLTDISEGFNNADFYATYLDPGTHVCFQVRP